ncbi:MAG: cytochrome c-type biogenesis protein CcmH [Candidatus Methanoperedenaceae archaeon]|nr:cytochrome c-type biogenesis protein CcmH [Candidatus Methanoperedenaceae archaeon]MDW7727461.1 cytochrome c-type biogenesis protein CcmH [Candidatus Methanoperedens sp.]
MIKILPLVSLSGALVFLITSIHPVLAEEDITRHLICPCECAMIISTCDCPTARQVKNEIMHLTNSGFSERQVYSALQKGYGEGIIAHPDRIGKTSLWIPGILLVIFLIFVGYIVSRKPNPGVIPIPGREKYERQFQEEYRNFILELEDK